jgi:hypothetical protein
MCTSLQWFRLSVSTIHFPALVPFVCEHVTLSCIGSVCLRAGYTSLHWFPLCVSTLHFLALVPLLCNGRSRTTEYPAHTSTLAATPPDQRVLLSPEGQSRLSDLSRTDRWSDCRKDRIMRKFVQNIPRKISESIHAFSQS